MPLRRCEFATSILGHHGGLLFATAKKEGVRFVLRGFLTDAQCRVRLVPGGESLFRCLCIGRQLGSGLHVPRW
jgi:hypothetical protein